MKTALKLAVFSALTIPCHAALSISLPENSESAAWTGLNNVKYPSSGGYNTFGTNSSPFNSDPSLAALQADAGSTLGGLFEKTSGGGYFSSSSIYNFGVPGTLTISDTFAITSLATVVFQLDLGSALNGVPVLSFNGGSQALSPDFQTTSPGSFLSGFGGPPAPTTNYAWQWDLSGESATSYEIVFTTIEHGTIFQADLAAGDSFAQVVPEPSLPMLGLLSVGAILARRRRG